jgi:ubiquinone biosynthesis protein
MLPLVRQTRHLGRYRQIVQVLAHHGFGYLLGELGLTALLSLPRRLVVKTPPPPPVGVAERLSQVLIELGPTFIKIGQFLSTRPDVVPPEFLKELEKLQDTVPSFSSDKAIAIIEAELGKPLPQLFRSFTRTPLAAASLGQVHAAILPDGSHVAVKVQRPDIASMIEMDLEIIADLAALAQERTALGEQYNLVELAWEFSTTLRRELDYQRERHNAERLRKIFADNTMVHIPITYADHTSTRVLTTERLFGAKITNLERLEEMDIDRIALARTVTRFILREIFSGFFHADPHPGNFFALPGGVVGAVDFGQVGIIGREMSHEIMFLIMAITRRDPENALRALEGMGIVDRQDITPQLRRDIQILIESMAGLPLSEISMHVTGGELFAIVRRHRMTMPGPVATLLRALMMMEGIGLHLDPNLDVFGIARPFVEQTIAEQFSFSSIGSQVLNRGRDIGQEALGLPEHIGNVLRRLNKGSLEVQTRELELRHLSRALVSAANYLGLSIVLASIILFLGLITVAQSIGGLGGTMQAVLIVMGALGAIVAALFLGLALWRGRD